MTENLDSIRIYLTYTVSAYNDEYTITHTPKTKNRPIGGLTWLETVELFIKVREL